MQITLVVMGNGECVHKAQTSYPRGGGCREGGQERLPEGDDICVGSEGMNGKESVGQSSHSRGKCLCKGVEGGDRMLGVGKLQFRGPFSA